jgi:hypothetical protein
MTFSSARLVRMALFAAVASACCSASAQQPPQPQQAPVQQVQAAPVQASSEWSRLPRMQLERQYAGPLQDTIVQRWRDPIDHTICYIYLPITAAHSAPTQAGFVQYGANVIGAISCFPTRSGGDRPKAP